ncbi:hypothetical protein ACJIZ3_006409 [Penstemon smallii]|uniref:Uncharacterized protein n=1 Tax=Penstemon smallii TaxID=265156 RepID=A0ABD3S7L0_9LAMI
MVGYTSSFKFSMISTFSTKVRVHSKRGETLILHTDLSRSNDIASRSIYEEGPHDCGDNAKGAKKRKRQRRKRHVKERLLKELAHLPVVLKVDDWIFSHGGLLSHHVEYGIERMNGEVSYWMKGLSMSDDFPESPFIATRGYDSVVQIFYFYLIQSILHQTLEAVGAKAMVVGHTPQAKGVNCEFNYNIWRIDVECLVESLIQEIREGKARAIRGKRDKYSKLQVVREVKARAIRGKRQKYLELQVGSSYPMHQPTVDVKLCLLLPVHVLKMQHDI